MELHFKTFREAFPFIEQLLLDAYRIESSFYTYPYEDMTKTDRGFRRMLLGATTIPEIFREYMNNASEYKIGIVKSSLGYYNIYASLSIGGKYPDFISVGPFCDEKISPAFIQKISSSKNLTREQQVMAMKYYEILPVADIEAVRTFVQHLLSAFIPEYKDITPIYLNYSESNQIITPDADAFWNFSSKTATLYAQYLKEFLEELTHGDSIKTTDKLKRFLDAKGTYKIRSLYHIKKQIHELNTFCKEKLLETTIHPYYVLRMSEDFSIQIDRLNTMEQLSAFPYKMIRKYCLLVKNHAFDHYSYTIKNVIYYIDEHLPEEELSLSMVAAALGKNASFLSSQFHKETGESITAYIHSARVKKALLLFHTTQLSVFEVAESVGIPNSRYFSKIFKEEIGMTPREYRAMNQG